MGYLLVVINAVVGGTLAGGCCALQFGLSWFLGIGCTGLESLLAPYRTLLVVAVSTCHLYLASSPSSSRRTRIGCSIVLGLMMCSPAIVKGLLASQASPGTVLQNDMIRMHIKDLGCSACRLAVKTGLQAVPGIKQCFVGRTGLTVCAGHVSDVAVLSRVVRSLGFDVMSGSVRE
jgi:hypothetical protein